MKNTRYNIGFRGKNQLSLFEIVKEYYINNELDFAKVIFQIKGSRFKKRMKKYFK